MIFKSMGGWERIFKPTIQPNEVAVTCSESRQERARVHILFKKRTN